MRNLTKTVVAGAVLAGASVASPAFAATVVGDTYFVNTFAGQDCPLPGGGGFNNCWATTSGTVATQPTDPTASRVVAAYATSGTASNINSASYSTFAGGEVTFSISNQILSLTYLMGAGDPKLTYLTIKQADGYALFYNSGGFASGTTYTFNLNSYFANNPGISHLTLFDSTGGAVPEPATWAMMLLGFGGIGMAMRRRRRSNSLMQIA